MVIKKLTKKLTPHHQSPSSDFSSKVSQDKPRALRYQQLLPYSKEPATDSYSNACVMNVKC